MATNAEPETPQGKSPPSEQFRPRWALWTDGPIIQMQNAGKNFGKDKIVVHDLNFEVTPGQIFCLLGPSGSGKSTTMRMLTGLYKPTEGKVQVFGQEPHKFRKKWRERIGYMPQQFVLFPEISTMGNVNFVASVYGMSWFKRSPKIKRALEFVDLWDSRNKLASQLSGGMQRRLELAATLVHNPELIFVDEPTAGIDPILRSKFWDHFRELRDQGRTIFVTTQYVTEADYCDKVAILNRGRVLAIGEPERIRRDAFGGDVVNLSLDFISPQAIEIIRHVPGVTYVQFLNTQDLKLTVTEGGETVPLIISALQEASISVKTIEQYRPDFEEVFVRLMEQDRAEEEEREEVQDMKIKDKVQAVGPAPVMVIPANHFGEQSKMEEYIRPQVAVQSEGLARAREIRPARPIAQMKSFSARRESPVPPGGPSEPFPPAPGPLPGPVLPGGPDSPPWPGQPGQSAAAQRPVVGSSNYQSKNPAQFSDDKNQDTLRLPTVPPQVHTGDENSDKQEVSK